MAPVTARFDAPAAAVQSGGGEISMLATAEKLLDRNAGLPTVSVIVPAYNAVATLGACLDAIHGLHWQPDEIIVFSDGSTDATDDMARDAGATVLRNDGAPRGPAYGRNEAAKAATSDLLLFVDADVVIAPEALEQLIGDMQRHGAKAAFGSYDDHPQSQRATSLYANLRHHFTHQHSAREATTFWSGLGLIEREAFLAAGGFDAKLFAYPSIEDIELGARLIEQGHRIRLVPEALATHCKDWPLLRVWHTDIVRRAYPWSCLLADAKTAGADLNVTRSEQVKALAALAIAALIPAALVATLLYPAAAALLWASVFAGIALYIALNSRFFGFLARRLSPRDTLVAIAMHWCYHIYSPATFVIVKLQTLLGLRGRAS